MDSFLFARTFQPQNYRLFKIYRDSTTSNSGGNELNLLFFLIELAISRNLDGTAFFSHDFLMVTQRNTQPCIPSSPDPPFQKPASFSPLIE